MEEKFFQELKKIVETPSRRKTDIIGSMGTGDGSGNVGSSGTSGETEEPGIVHEDGMRFDTNHYTGRIRLRQHRLAKQMSLVYQDPNITLDEANSRYDELKRQWDEGEERMLNPTEYDLKSDVERQTEAQKFWIDLNLRGAERRGRLSPSDDDYFNGPNNATTKKPEPYYPEEYEPGYPESNYPESNYPESGTPPDQTRKKPKKQSTFKSIFRNN